MLGSRTVRSGLHWVLVLAAALVALLAAPGAALADDPPVVGPASVDPTTLSYQGGTVVVTAYVSDDIGPVEVYADVSSNGSTPMPYAMSHDSGAYYGYVEFPGNYTSSPVTWTIRVRARDLDQQETSALAGTITQEAQPANFPATVSDPSVSPTSLPSGGGMVSLGITASDSNYISDAFATVTPTGGSPIRVQLLADGVDRYTGTFAAPANTTSTAAAYTVRFTVFDDVGQETTVDGAGFTVASAPATSTGKLELWPGSLSFGDVKVGKRERRWIVLRNTGPRATKALVGVIRSTGVPFFVVGDGRFDLRPGQSKAFQIEFRPTAAGARTGRVNVARTDGGQPSLGAALSGRGRTR